MIPTYNEIENIDKLLSDLSLRQKKSKKHKIEVLIVDDNSPDGTGEVVKQYQNKNKWIYLLTGKKKGLGSAMIRGYKYALGQLKPDVIVTNEADFAFDFKHLNYMLGSLEKGNDVVVGSRHVGVGKTSGWTVSRRLNHWVANTIFATWVAGVGEVYDHNGAFRAIRVKGVLDKINFDLLKTKGFAFFFYFLYETAKVTNKFDEFPVIYRFRQRGESKVSFNIKYIKTYIRDVFEYMSHAIKIRFEKTKKWLT